MHSPTQSLKTKQRTLDSYQAKYNKAAYAKDSIKLVQRASTIKV